MGNKKIKDFDLDDNITSFFSVRKKTVREYSRGRFVSLELGDCSGRINGVIWEPDQFSLAELTPGMVVKVRGVVGEYNNVRQLTVSKIRLAEDDEYSLEDILPHSKQPIEERRARILTLTEKIENSYTKTLVNSFWEDEAFFEEYLTAAAGKLWHHAHVGGLSEHSANVAELALGVAAGYDFLDKDYLVFGGLLHDAGKASAYSVDTVIDYTDEGRLVGHICIADEWVCRRAEKIAAFPDKLLTELRHVILSHHGTKEFASPVVPMMPEAFVLYYCDEIDSKLGAIDRIRERHQGKGWSDYIRLLDRYLYFGEEREE